MKTSQDLYLMHHGIKGMKWGVRRFEDANGHLTPAGKRRYAVQDARKYYKINRLQRAQEKNRDPDINEHLSKRIRRVQTRSDRKHADLNQRDINIGRQIVAKNRRNWAMVGTAAKAAATAAGAYALYQNPNTRALVPLAVAGGAALTYGSAKKVPYYTMEARRYKQVNPKGATKKGLTKQQKSLRKAGKIAAVAALAGASGYALYKTGAAKSAIDAGKNMLSNKIGIGDYTAQKKDGSSYRTSNNTKQRRRDVASKVKTGVKEKVASTVRSKIVDGVDEEDPRTWTKVYGNTKDFINDMSRYGRAANNLRTGNAIGAASEMSDEITDASNKAIDSVKTKVNGIRNRKRKKK